MEPSVTLARAIKRVTSSPRMSEGMRICKARASEFLDTLTMQLAGIAMIPDARATLDSALDEYWGAYDYISASESTPNELIIGAGVHAAVYSAARVRMGFPRPLVVEASPRVGGAFAVSAWPSFRLNSSNRPGILGSPGEGVSLNYLPGSVIQADYLSGDEYSTNTDIAFCVRTALAQFANVKPSNRVTEVSGINPYGDRMTVYLSNGNVVRPYRIIDARGLGSPTPVDGARGNVQTFPEFLASLDSPWPLQGLRRVAVIGSGDAARCTVEALLGIGPNGGRMNAAGLDYVDRIDWYGTRVPGTCKAWRQQVRPRYARIGAYLPRKASAEPRRIRVIPQLGYASQSLDGAYVNGKTYDRAILCTGNVLAPITGIPSQPEYVDQYTIGGASRTQNVVARKDENGEYYYVGPSAKIPFSTREQVDGIANIDANRVAMFRLTGKTATLAANLKSY